MPPLRGGSASSEAWCASNPMVQQRALTALRSIPRNTGICRRKSRPIFAIWTRYGPRQIPTPSASRQQSPLVVGSHPVRRLRHKKSMIPSAPSCKDAVGQAATLSFQPFASRAASTCYCDKTGLLSICNFPAPLYYVRLIDDRLLGCVFRRPEGRPVLAVVLQATLVKECERCMHVTPISA